MTRTAGRTGGTDVSHAGRGGAVQGMAPNRLIVVLAAVLCVLGLTAASAEAGAVAAATAAVQGPHAAQSDLGQHPHAPPQADSIDPGSTCHGGPGTPADPLLPAPLALHVPPPDPAPPAARVVAAPGISGPANDEAGAVDLHRLRIQRT
ncbi:hypothetical protein [Streptomyces hainanensis]|uniref:Uncharacterized protein n=1 Tax=Streptomyces hainanensis TaxID=402648 RepID=A0A4R4THC2_9ACTN|nr:hypothetical protein [Streptomyces hainanensis]TDC73739.1 hypothetical protein E1283_18285 [Streptomyces hainanensis]